MDQFITLIKKELDYRTNESYKALRTNIQFCGDDLKILAFTSCTPNEGKSSVTINLAQSFAEAGKKVILIDADLRKSVLVGRYKVGQVENGLTHYLTGQVEMEEAICHTQYSNLDIMFAGTYSPNPAELLNHNRFRTMLATLREKYDYVLVDTPPLGSVIDSAIIARNVDGAVIVLEANAIGYKFAQSVKEQLEKSNCRILGVVFNKVPMDKKGYYGKYYGKYYGNYGK